MVLAVDAVTLAHAQSIAPVTPRPITAFCTLGDITSVLPNAAVGRPETVALVAVVIVSLPVAVSAVISETYFDAF